MKEILLKRHLLSELIIRSLKVRYSQPGLGFFWAFLSPFLIAGIFYLVFSMILRVKIEEAPFFLYLMSGIFPWRFFQEALVASTTSLVDNKNLIRESNLPHYLIPVSIALASAVNFFPPLAILIIVSGLILGGLPAFIIYLPLVLLIHLTITIGLSIILSVLYVKWRDVKYILETVLLFLFYLTPIVYSIYLVKDRFSDLLFKIYIYNPLVGMLNLYRASFFKGFYPLIQKETGPGSFFIMPLGLAAVILLVGFCCYKRNKNSINDYLSY